MPDIRLSEHNKGWGICGFTSALTHLYDSDVRLKSKIQMGNTQQIRLGLLTEVVTFLKYVVAFRGDLISGLDALNLALPSKSMKKGVIGFIPLAEQAVRNQLLIDDENNDYQCALTPRALTLYLQKMCGFIGAKLTTGDDPGGRGVVGLMNAKNELQHWVYRDSDGNVYNWGDIITPSQWKTHQYGLGHPSFHHVGCHVSFG